MHLVFPDSTTSGSRLLILRLSLLNWTRSTGIPHEGYVENNEYRVRLPEDQHYTQFALQWDWDRFYIVP